MRTIGQVAVYPMPGSKIARLTDLAYNLWWSWNPAAQDLCKLVDSQLWTRVNHNPVKFLRLVSQRKLDAAAADPAYVARYQAVMAAFDAYMDPAAATWYARTHADKADRLIAYFSAEFGLHESLPIYSGGLGILSAITARRPATWGCRSSAWVSSIPRAISPRRSTPTAASRRFTRSWTSPRCPRRGRSTRAASASL